MPIRQNIYKFVPKTVSSRSCYKIIILSIEHHSQYYKEFPNSSGFIAWPIYRFFSSVSSYLKKKKHHTLSPGYLNGILEKKWWLSAKRNVLCFCSLACIIIIIIIFIIKAKMVFVSWQSLLDEFFISIFSLTLQNIGFRYL